MPRTRFEDVHCPVAQAAAAVGDGWSLLILREAFMGTRRFEDFVKYLDVSRNVLTQRLEHLVDHALLERRPITPRSRRCEYVLTEKGADLLTVLVALREWSNRWIYGEGNEPTRVIDVRTGEPPAELIIRDSSGRPVPPQFLSVVAGPGADKSTLDRLVDAER